MDIDVLKQLQGLVHTFGVDVYVHKAPYEHFEHMDAGLRRQLYTDIDYGRIAEGLDNTCMENAIYIMTDEFEINYMIFKIPSHLKKSKRSELVTIGPYITRAYETIIPDIIEKNHLSLYHISVLNDYYNGIAMIVSRDLLESIVVMQAEYIFGGTDQFLIERINVEFWGHDSQDNIVKNMDNTLSVTLIEERYKQEDEFLEAIEQGDLARAIVSMNALNRYRMDQRNEDLQRDSKNMMIVLNTLCRKAVQRAEVHPAHIDSVSSMFAKRIETCNNDNELKKIVNEIPRKYCMLVRRHSLKGYSKLIQNALNYIDFNLTEPLSLKHISGITSVNASYLSAQFKKETGSTITDYINHKRIESSLMLLATTDLPVYVIAEKVGINDENYFSRLFKKIQDMTAVEYRNLVKRKNTT